MYAAGKIPAASSSARAAPTERAILTARMIDRPIRPLWPKGFRNEVQVICTVLSADMVTAHDILCINGASAALMISPLPFFGPVGAVRVGLIDGELVVNPTLPEAEDESNARPDRRRHEGRPDDGRGRRRGGPRGHAARGARARARGDQEALRGAGGAAARRPARRSGSTRTLTAELESQHGRAIRERIEEVGLREAGGDRRGAPGRARRRSCRWTRPRRTSSASCRSRSASRCCSSSSGSRPSQGAGARRSSRTTCAP